MCEFLDINEDHLIEVCEKKKIILNSNKIKVIEEEEDKKKL